jgi:hypothetical protein
VLLEQDSIAATVYIRDGDRMVVETVARGDMPRLPEFEGEIPVNDLYRVVEPKETAVAVVVSDSR